MINNRTCLYSSVFMLVLLMMCNGASSDSQAIGEKITEWSATVTPGKVSKGQNEVHLH